MATETYYSTIDLTEDDPESEETSGSIQFQFVDCTTSTPTTSSKSVLEVNKHTGQPLLTPISKEASRLGFVQHKQVNLVKPMVSNPQLQSKNMLKGVTLPKFIKIKHVNRLQPYNASNSNIQNVGSNLKSNSGSSKPNTECVRLKESEIIRSSKPVLKIPPPKIPPPKIAPSKIPPPNIKIHNNILLMPPKLVPFQKSPPPNIITKPKQLPPPEPIKTKNALLEGLNRQKTSIQQQIASLTAKNTVPTKILTTNKPQHTQFVPSPSTTNYLNNIFKIHPDVPNTSDILLNNTTHLIKIPNEILPLINSSKGPIIFDIPGVGPLMIKNNTASPVQTIEKNVMTSQAQTIEKNALATRTQNVEPVAQTTKPVVSKVPVVHNSESEVMQPFSLNFQDLLVSDDGEVSMSEPQRKVKVGNVLADKKFCWQNKIYHRKIDREGFTATDRLGFYKAEQKKARKCENTLMRHIVRLEQQFSDSLDSYQSWKASRRVLRRSEFFKNVRLVEIDKIKSGKSFLPPEFTKGTKQPDQNDKFRNLEAIEIEVDQQTNCSSSDDSDGATKENELLFTKKVVFIKENTRKSKRKSKNRTEIRRRNKELYLQKKNSLTTDQIYLKKYNIKSCCVEIDRDPLVEEAYEKKLEVGKRKTVENKANARKYQSLLKLFNERIIYSIETFKHLISKVKPILVINERQLREHVNFSELFVKHNVIFCVKADHEFPKHLFRHEAFINAVELGYVKLVSHWVLCKYLESDDAFLK